MKKCAICGCDSMAEIVSPETFEYKGVTKVIQEYHSYECIECGESFMNQNFHRSIEGVLRDFHRSVDGLLVSSEIKAIRESLGFNQEQMGLKLGGGKKAFARYENGKLTQSKAMNSLLIILREDPSVIRHLDAGINLLPFSAVSS